MCLNSHVFFVFFYVAIQLKAICTLVLQVLKLCINRFLLYIMWSDFFKCPVDRLRCSLSSVQSLSRVRLFANPWIAARQAFPSITNSRSSLRLTFIESVMISSHLILCLSLLPLPPIPPSIRVFPNESTLRMRWPKYWSFSFSIISSKEIPGLISFSSKNKELVTTNNALIIYSF